MIFLDLESKHALAHLSVPAAARLTSGIAFHVVQARNAGAAGEEAVSALLVGLPAVGHAVAQALPAAIEAYDTPDRG